MDEVGRLILLLALGGVGLTLLGGVAIWFLDEGRRIRRSLKSMLKGELHAWLVARGRGKGIGFDFAGGGIAVSWDTGVWCLPYRIDELRGAELIIDDQIAARAYRGEGRRGPDQFPPAARLVRLRFVFDDPAWPDFPLDLWLPEDSERRGALTAAEAAQEGHRWIGRMESLFRRPGAHGGAPTPEFVVMRD